MQWDAMGCCGVLRNTSYQHANQFIIWPLFPRIAPMTDAADARLFCRTVGWLRRDLRSMQSVIALLGPPPVLRPSCQV